MNDEQRKLLIALNKDSETAAPWGSIYGAGHPPLTQQFDPATFDSLVTLGLLQICPDTDGVEYEISEAGKVAVTDE